MHARPGRYERESNNTACAYCGVCRCGASGTRSATGAGVARVGFELGLERLDKSDSERARDDHRGRQEATVQVTADECAVACVCLYWSSGGRVLMRSSDLARLCGPIRSSSSLPDAHLTLTAPHLITPHAST